VPLWPILWLLAFATAARVKLGYWPSYNQPDPSTLWFTADFAVLPLLLLAPIAAFASVINALFRWQAGRPPVWSACLTTFASLVVLWLWLAVDPGGFFTWWVD